MPESVSKPPPQPNISNVPKKDSVGKPIPNTSDGTLVRIRLFDDRERVLFFKDNNSPTAKQVCEMVGQKLDISSEALSAFSLWISGHDLELQIRPKMELLDMVAKWSRYFEKYTHATVEGGNQYKFVFKREAMLTKADEEKIKDETAIKLLFGEARNNVLNGKYPISSLDDVAKLTALTLYINYGDYNYAKHGPGTNYVVNLLPNFLPKHMITKIKTQEWESKLINAWSSISSKGLAPYIDYLNLVKKFPYYGATFFPACKNVPAQGYFELRTDHLLVAVNSECLCVIDDDRHRLAWNGPYDGVEWECTPDSITIEYMPPSTSGAPPPKKSGSTLITPQAHLIDSLASRAIYLIEKQEKIKKGLVKKKHPNAGGTVRGDKGSSRRPSVQVSVVGDRSKRVSAQSFNTPGSPTSDMPGRTLSPVEDKDEAADYLQQVNQIRKMTK